LEKIASIEAALTKGRKHGLRVVAGLQSTAQLDKIYGRHEAQTLRSCFRSLVVLGGARTDPQTCDDMSKALGEHEVERDQRSYDRSFQGHRVSVRPERVRERIVLPTEIAGLPDLTGYIGFAGDRPVARVTLEHYEYRNINEPFVER
jgi:type IV secretory pathway TraG/TraD family ATPase VirD4